MIISHTALNRTVATTELNQVNRETEPIPTLSYWLVASVLFNTCYTVYVNIRLYQTDNTVHSTSV